MKRFLTIALAGFIVAFCGVTYAAGKARDGGKVELLARALDAMHFVPSFKYGLNYQKAHLGANTPFIEGALHMDDGLLVQIFARVYARHLSMAQIQALDHFYESSAGRELTAEQTRDPTATNPLLTLTPQQLAQAQAFSTSPAGKKMQWLMTSNDVRTEADSAIGSFIVGSNVAGCNDL